MNQPTVDNLMQWRENKDYRTKLALCNTCGTVRKAKQPRHHDCNNNTGQLKCISCNQITTHALVSGSNYDEYQHSLGLGMPERSSGEPLTRAMDDYRRGFKTNPLLGHWNYIKDGKAALERGETKVRALCGEMMEIYIPEPDQTPRGKTTGGKKVKPEGQTLDGREYDPDDHGEWRNMDCPNCLRVWHNELARRRRDDLKKLMTTALCELHDPQYADLYDPHTEKLIQFFRAVHGENG